MIKPLIVAAGAFGVLWLLGTYGDGGKLLGVAVAPTAQGTAAAAIVVLGEFLRKYVAGPDKSELKQKPAPSYSEDHRQLKSAYDDLANWARQAEDYIANINNDTKTIRHRQELLRLFIASALGVALVSCTVTLLMPPSKSQQMHIYFLAGGYAIAGLWTGVIACLRLSAVKFRHVLRLGFISAFYAGAIALLISVAYSDRWAQDVVLFGLPPVKLLAFVAGMRLLILPFIACICVYIGSRISCVFFPSP